MPRTIDSLSTRDEESRPKPAAEKQAPAGGSLASKPVAANAPVAKPSAIGAKSSANKTPDSGSKKSKQSKLAIFKGRHKLFYGLGGLVLIIGLAIIGWQNWGRDYVATHSKDPNVKPIAKVDGSYITEKQYADALEDKKKLNKALYGDKATTNPEEETYNDLVLERALMQEAAKHKISISNEDVNAQIKKANQDRAKILELAAANRVNETDALRGYRIYALKAKLATYLLDTRDVRQYAVRWDYGPTGTDIVDKGDEFTAFQVSVKEKLRQVVEVPLKQGKKFDDFKSSINLNLDQDSDEYKPMDVLSRTIVGMNRNGDKAFQDGDKDWDAIEKLNTAGQYSEIIRSDGGYFAIYQLLVRNNGRYTTWDDYANAVRRSSKKFVKADYTKAIIATDFEKRQCRQEADSLFRKVLSFVGVGKADAIACGSNHWNIFTGHVQNQLTGAISGATVHMEQRVVGSGSLCGGFSGNEGDYTTDGAGNWNAGDHWSCFTKWRAVYSAPGCSTVVKDILNPGTNNGVVPAGTVTLVCGSPNRLPVVSISVDCDADKITGYAYDTDNTNLDPSNPLYDGLVFGQTTVAIIYFGSPNASPPYSLPGGNLSGEDCTILGCRFISTVGPWVPGTLNPSFKAINPGPKGNLYFEINGLLAKTGGGRNLKDGNTYSYMGIALDFTSFTWSIGDNQSWTTCKHDVNYNVVGDKAYDGPPAPAPPINELKAGLVWANKPSQSTSSLQAGSDTSWQLSNLDRTAANTISADSANNWEPYAYTICLDGNTACHNPANKVFSNNVSLDANFFQQGTAPPHIRWYYRPKTFSIAGNTSASTGGLSDTSYRNGTHQYSGAGIPASGIVNAQPGGTFGFNNIAYDPGLSTNLNIIANKPAISSVNWLISSATYCIDSGGGCTQGNATLINFGTSKYFTINPQTIPGGSTIRVTWYYSVTDSYLYYDKVAPANSTGSNSYGIAATAKGRILVNGTVVCKDSGDAGGVTSTCNYGTVKAMPFGTDFTISAEPVSGYQVRGYSYCVSNGAICGTVSDTVENPVSPADTSGKIVSNPSPGNTTANGSAVSVSVQYSNGSLIIGGRNVGNIGSVFFRFYYRPKTVTIQARGVIDMEGGVAGSISDTDINPCIASDYKKDICNNVLVRAIRMNTANENSDPVGGLLCGNDLVPKLPGYNYSFFKNYYCAADGQASGATPWIKLGQTWNSTTNLTTGNDLSDPLNANAAYFKDVYPGNYKLQYKQVSIPKYAATGEDAYTVQTANCPVNSSNCSNAVTPVDPHGGCFLNHRQVWYRATPSFTDPNVCTNNLGNSADDLPDASGITTCTGTYLNFYPSGNGCAYYKANNKNNSLHINVPTADNGWGEATFFFTPKFKTVTSTNSTMNCNTFEADVIYMPDPGRNVSMYFRINNNDLRDESGAIIPYTTDAVHGNPHVFFKIPKYNYPTLNLDAVAPKQSILKDGQSRQFRIFAQYPDDDLNGPAAGYANATKVQETPGWKYTPKQIDDGTLRHKCVNQADCSAFSASGVTYLDQDASPFKITMRMTNTGQSYWMDNHNEGGSNRTTGHTLSVSAATPTGANGWQINYTQMSNDQVVPSAPDGPDAVAGQTSFDYTVMVSPPPDGGTNVTLEFVMSATYTGNVTDSGLFPNPTPPAWQCKTKVEIRQSYAPWLRVQNGNVSSLNYLMNQPKGARGTYKSQNTTLRPSPYKGTSEFPNTIGNNLGSNGKADINLHAQYAVIGLVGSSNGFCSSNAYVYGRDPSTGATVWDPVAKNCSTPSGYSINLEDRLRSDLSADTADTNEVFNKARDITLPGGGICDDTNISISDSHGPKETAQPNAYYKFAGPMSTPDLTDATLQTLNGKPSLVRVYDTQSTPQQVDRPCPTVYSFGNTLGVAGGPATTVYSGRATLVVNGDLNIVNDVKYDYSKVGPTVYKYATSDDQTALNFLPNLGVVVNGDIIISGNVNEISGDYFATGKIRTCANYNTVPPSPTSGDTVGNSVGQTLKAANSYQTDPNGNRSAYKDDSDSALCNKKLIVRGTLASSGFNLGRNYVNFGDISTPNTMVYRINNNPGVLLGLSPFGKFCVDKAATPITCGVDFDNPGKKNGVDITQSEGYRQSYYYGGPAEDILGNGLSLILPPPGFIDTGSDAITKPKYIDTNSTPRF